jgi:hypothetical protein
MHDKSLYTYFNENSAMGQRFGGMIQMYNAGKPFFWEDGWYPIKERLVEGGPKSDEDVLLIDIGGELKHIVDRSTQDGFEAQIGDWYQEQPIKGTFPASAARSRMNANERFYRRTSIHAPTHSSRL